MIDITQENENIHRRGNTTIMIMGTIQSKRFEVFENLARIKNASLPNTRKYRHYIVPNILFLLFMYRESRKERQKKQRKSHHKFS